MRQDKHEKDGKDGRRRLEKARQKTVLVRIRRSDKLESLEGYIVGLSEMFVLLHLLDPNGYLNGYTALRMQDVKEIRLIDDSKSCLHRALQLRGIVPIVPDKIDLMDWPVLLCSVGSHYSLLTVHLERREPDICFIGQARQVSTKVFEMRKIDPAAQWIETELFKFKYVTRLDFGGGYEEALWLVANQVELK